MTVSCRCRMAVISCETIFVSPVSHKLMNVHRVCMRFFAQALAVLAVFLPSVRAQVTTSQYDNARTGANLAENILTPSNVNSKQFGKLFSLRVDGDVYAQPLFLPQIEIAGKGVHNVVFVATERDSVFAFDADGRTAEPLWQVSFLSLGNHVESLLARDVQCPFIAPVVGITSTPVIDAASGTIFVLARTKENGHPVQRLHALDVHSGAEKFGGPVEIKASVPHKSLGMFASQVAFDPLRDNPRAALLLANGRVYLSWASSCDVGTYHGWVMSYDAHTLSQVAVFNASPNSDQSGIWAGDTGPAADDSGNIFLATGNGSFDANSGGRDYGDSVLKLAGTDLSVRDYFTPFNQEKLNDSDDDLGSGGPVLLPAQSGAYPHVLVVAGKGGVIYVIDRDTMGKFHAGNDAHAVQTLPLADSAFGAPAYWNQHLFWLVSNDVLRDYAVHDAHLALAAQSTTKFSDPGATPTVSADGAKNGIVWVIQSKGWRDRDTRAVLHAYDAMNVSRELYNSEQNSSRDGAGNCLRFTIPTVANGHVYVGTKSELDVYGLLPAPGKSRQP